METKSKSGRQVKTPAKFCQTGSLGAAVGGGGLLSTPKLPGISGAILSATGGDAAVDTQHEAQAGGDRAQSLAVATTASAPSANSLSRNEQLRAIMADPRFALDDDDQQSHSEEPSPVVVGGDSIDVDVDSGDYYFRVDVGAGQWKWKGKGKEKGSTPVGFRGGGPDEGSSSGAVSEAGSGGRSSSGASSGGGSGVAATAKGMKALAGSLRRNRDKSYDKWPAVLLQTACSLRSISGFSKSSDVDKMAGVLKQLDTVLGRRSPFLGDLDDKAAGGTPSTQPPASEKEFDDPPEQLVLAVKSAVAMGTSFAAGKMFPCNGKSYPVAPILALLKERKRSEDGNESTPVRKKKSKHCIPRFCEIVALEEFRWRWAAHRTQLSKQELDMKTGKTRDVLIDVWKAWKDELVVVPNTFGDDHHVVAAGIDPNVVHQPDIAYEKFIAMKNDICKDHGEMYANYTQSGSNGEIHSFCRGNLDTYYYGLMVLKHPEIQAATTQMLPKGTESENTGVRGKADGEGGVKSAAKDADRRAAAKAGAKERNAALSDQGKKAKRQRKEVEKAAKAAVGAVKEELGLGALLGGSSGPEFADAPTSYYDTKEGCDSRAAKLDLGSKFREQLLATKARIKQEKAKGPDADEEDLAILEGQASQLRVALAKMSKEAL